MNINRTEEVQDSGVDVIDGIGECGDGGGGGGKIAKKTR